uniref:Uncharacterized protein n=1 Tax=Arundo donax TaxID=35708 RepID=A0A0A9ER10_ARUDO
MHMFLIVLLLLLPVSPAHALASGKCTGWYIWNTCTHNCQREVHFLLH